MRKDAGLMPDAPGAADAVSSRQDARFFLVSSICLYNIIKSEYKINSVARQRHELWAEAIRDIGILFLVFAPLETLLKISQIGWWDWLRAVGIAILGYLLIEKGVRMESET